MLVDPGVKLFGIQKQGIWWQHRALGVTPVSYTHLDVYKRQGQFDADGVVNGLIVDPGALGSATRQAASVRDKMLALYIAYYDRAPDAAGLQYWLAQAQAGVSMNDISAGFASHPRFAQEYGGLTNDQIAAKLYTCLLYTSRCV